ncbi:HAMP domain-containing sensor histidine kinase [Bacteroides sp. 51]|uniref:sensor histidine kinase n=1 Tax=Bacteroides sp. 51 TaxID=2302938 RepID=UPI0013D17F17|nr:HAMP domain-containing sensor histidine kinase [Bacteroides sp. 51]NDV83719.1 sensor histidine kinase [Bacteroides sp. 51]
MLDNLKLSICLSISSVFLLLPLNLSAAIDDNPILIISSYNPDSHSTSTNITDFMDEFNRLGGQNPTLIENMNCKSFAESTRWKSRMARILLKYETENRPSLIVLLGQEAWASYLSQEDTTLMNVPVVVAMASQNAIILPDQDTLSLSTWMPESIDFASGSLANRIRGGLVYQYDIEGNINLIKQIYPATKNVALITDNSYGGVAMQALVRKEMSNHPELNLLILDGRTNTVYTLLDELRELPDNTVLLVGTWRVDKNEGYSMRNATYAMMDAVPHMPTFSISSVGLGYWAIGGVIPMYRPQGKELAKQAFDILRNPMDTSSYIQTIPNKIRLDNNKVKELNIDLSQFPSDIMLVNQPPSFYETYKYEVWVVISTLLTLLIGFLVALYFYVRTKRLKDKLIISEAELRIAKDRAEESNRLKSAFLANMSHEIRTPLNSIVGFSNVLAAGDTSPEEQQMYADVIQTNSDLLLRLINDILDLSRLETDRVSFAFENADVVGLMQQVITSIGYANKNNNELIFNSEISELTMMTDVQRLQQVVINLLSNAAKFTKNGKITLTLEIDKTNDKAVFSVADTGPGIPQDKQKLIFERFEKLNEYAQGAGLGLSICLLIVTKFGGEIWVDPTYTLGARFVFTHPLHINNTSTQQTNA